ncbi:unnamed protein product [Owenia fusiformis]|uniref:Delta-like protein n=1 Tax=Owenia fusiformis TaxID=6347 RepID=A0A8J1U4W1_OWEFU|nr:unnamed protein product [Owenia fusiformis]
MLPHRTVPALAFGLLNILLFISTVSSNGAFELNLQNFKNDNGFNSDGHCCNGILSNGKCTSPCKTFFRICLTHYMTNIDANTASCTFGEVTTPTIGDNSFTFPPSKGTGFVNPIRIPFDFAWPGTFSLIVQAWHDSTLDGPSKGSPRELISQLAKQASREVGPHWSQKHYHSGSSDLFYRYRVVCDEHYYGNKCTEYCKPRDDKNGHYTCNDEGEKVCLDGYTGAYCNEVICLPGCHPEHGFCSNPSECKCKFGWQGTLCDECIPYPGCQHGTCKGTAWTCECDEGWGGIFCNLDLNFCTHHQPCKNGATCHNAGQGSYMCSCPPGYSGKDCEIPSDCTAMGQQCQNGGTCEGRGGEFNCNCPTGFFGDRCQYMQQSTCSPNLCRNGATCTKPDDSPSYVCICPPGFTGINCERIISHCDTNTCENGGTCSTINDGFLCSCRPGYEGQRCEVNLDECRNNPCTNGGSCVDGDNSFKCHCKLGYTGSLCNIDINECEMNPCANGGTCTDLENDFSCKCTPEFTGYRCDQHIGDNPDVGITQHSGGITNSGSGTAVDIDTTLDNVVTDLTTTENSENSGNSGAIMDNNSVITDASFLTMQQLLLIICLGVGIPIVIIIVLIIILLCKRSRRENRDNTEDTIKKQNEQNHINNLKNKCIDTEIIHSIPPSKMCINYNVTNEQQDSKIYKTVNIQNTKTCNSKRINTDYNSSTQQDSIENTDFEKPHKKVSEHDTVSIDTEVDISEYQADVEELRKSQTNKDTLDSPLHQKLAKNHNRQHRHTDTMLATEV